MFPLLITDNEIGTEKTGSRHERRGVIRISGRHKLSISDEKTAKKTCEDVIDMLFDKGHAYTKSQRETGETRKICTFLRIPKCCLQMSQWHQLITDSWFRNHLVQEQFGELCEVFDRRRDAGDVDGAQVETLVLGFLAFVELFQQILQIAKSIGMLINFMVVLTGTDWFWRYFMHTEFPGTFFFDFH